MSKTENDTNSLWSNIGPLGGAVLGIVLILLALIASLWVPFVALLIPLVIIVVVAGVVMGSRSTPSRRAEQDLRVAQGYRPSCSSSRCLPPPIIGASFWCSQSVRRTG